MTRRARMVVVSPVSRSDTRAPPSETDRTLVWVRDACPVGGGRPCHRDHETRVVLELPIPRR